MQELQGPCISLFSLPPSCTFILRLTGKGGTGWGGCVPVLCPGECGDRSSMTAGQKETRDKVLHLSKETAIGRRCSSALKKFVLNAPSFLN